MDAPERYSGVTLLLLELPFHALACFEAYKTRCLPVQWGFNTLYVGINQVRATIIYMEDVNDFSYNICFFYHLDIQGGFTTPTPSVDKFKAVASCTVAASIIVLLQLLLPFQLPILIYQCLPSMSIIATTTTAAITAQCCLDLINWYPSRVVHKTKWTSCKRF